MTKRFTPPATPAHDSVENLQAVLSIAQYHLTQYAAYAEEMRAIGRGMVPSSPFSPETLAYMIEDALQQKATKS